MYRNESVSRKVFRLGLATYFGVNAFLIPLREGCEAPRSVLSQNEATRSEPNREPTTEELRNTPVKEMPDYLKRFTIEPGQKLPE